MKKKITFREFLALLPVSGWRLSDKGKIVRQGDPGVCPWLFVLGLPGVTNKRRWQETDARQIWDAADDFLGHRLSIRKRLLEACGLTADGRQLYGR